MEPVLKNKIENLPAAAGVYFFKDAGERVIYVGKAKNLKKRIKNHFQKPEQHFFDFIPQIADIDYILADSESAALILEQQFIKKLQPRWNVEWKDDKSYFHIALTDETFPRVFLAHPPNLNRDAGLQGAASRSFGPFVSGKEVKSFLREIRNALPYRSCRNLPGKPCFYRSLGLCAAPCLYKKRKTSYVKMIDTLEALIKIYENKFVQGATLHNCRVFRIEGYDISNLAGTLAAGSMVVFENGAANKNEYRKFKIKTVAGQNDVASLREVLQRRLKHTEWPLPDLIILDGGKGQLKAARGIKIPVVALAKIGDKNGPPNGEARRSGGKLFTPYSKNFARLSKLPSNLSYLFLQIRNEAHRYAITYNKHRRANFLKKESHL